MRFEFFGTKIYLSFPFFAVLCLMLCFDKTGLMAPTLFSVILHETGHLFAMWLLNSPPVSVDLIPASVRITERPFISLKKTVIIALSGPFLNLAAALTALLNFTLYKNGFALNFGIINLALGIFNLLPCSGLDGGTVLKNILCRKLTLEKAELCLKFSTFIIAAAIFVLGVLLFYFKKFNISVFLIALYLFICGIMLKE